MTAQNITAQSLLAAIRAGRLTATLGPCESVPPLADDADQYPRAEILLQIDGETIREITAWKYVYRAKGTRERVYRELLESIGCLTAEEGAALVHWTPQGFARTATRENCAYIRLGHKQPTLYPIAEVRRMLDRLRVWPKGRPVEVAAVVAEERRAA